MTTKRDQTTLLKQDVLGRVTLTRDKREALLDAASVRAQRHEGAALRPHGRGQLPNLCLVDSKAPSCPWRLSKDGGHAKTALQRPLRSAQPNGKTTACLQLVEVALPSSSVTPSTPVAPAALELLLPGGARLHLHDASQAELAAHLLRHLNSTASPAC
ncbi:MAG: hypothetical protein IPK22_19465 [Verrucomicrobiaceae bacterium]|nr:hypothetical protein [Verrucomicrobiaceae bacterium]